MKNKKNRAQVCLRVLSKAFTVSHCKYGVTRSSVLFYTACLWTLSLVLGIVAVHTLQKICQREVFCHLMLSYYQNVLPYSEPVLHTTRHDGYETGITTNSHLETVSHFLILVGVIRRSWTFAVRWFSNVQGDTKVIGKCPQWLVMMAPLNNHVSFLNLGFERFVALYLIVSLDKPSRDRFYRKLKMIYIAAPLRPSIVHNLQ